MQVAVGSCSQFVTNGKAAPQAVTPGVDLHCSSPGSRVKQYLALRSVHVQMTGMFFRND